MSDSDTQRSEEEDEGRAQKKSERWREGGDTRMGTILAHERIGVEV